MEYSMKLTSEELDILSGAHGETKAKILKTIVEYGEIFGATHLVPVESTGHLVTSAGLAFLKPVYRIMDEIIDAGLKAEHGFTVDPRPDYDDIKPGFLERFIFRKKIYPYQSSYEEQIKKAGLINDNAFTCACYLEEAGNIPAKGEYLSWAESSAVVYANSVIGARCNRNSGMIDLFGNIAGRVPYFGLLTDEGRMATWVIDIKCSRLPEAQVLGSAIGMQVMEDVPYIRGLEKFLGTEVTPEVQSYLKDMGAAMASNGAVGLYHIHNLTPEAKESGDKLITDNPRGYTIDDRELERVINSYPVTKKRNRPGLCFIGCPHLSFSQLENWTDKLSQALAETGRSKVKVKTVMSSAPDVLEKFRGTERYNKLVSMGITVSGICPLMYTANPLTNLKHLITNSNKLRTYSMARYYTDQKIVDILSGREVK